MRVFDFKCKLCQYTEERMVKDDSSPPCAKCGGETTKQLSAPAMIQTPFSGGRTVTR